MTELRKTQGHMGGDPRRQAQELERSVQEAMARVESNAPSFLGYFDDGAFLPTGTQVKIHRVKNVPAERIAVNGKDPDGNALIFRVPGYYLLNFSTSVRMQTNTGTCTLRAVIDKATVAGCFARAINNAAANIPLIGSGIVRVPKDRPMTFIITSTVVSGSGNSDVRFSAPTLGHYPTFSLVYIRPLEGGKDANR